MLLRRHLVLPGGFRRGRIPVRLIRDNENVLDLWPASHFGEATHQIVDALGLPMITHLSERDVVISEGIAKNSPWEPAESMVLQSLIRPGMGVLDLGANIGWFSMLAARAAGRMGRIYAFEPEAANALILSANIAMLADLEPRAAPIMMMRTAIGDWTGTARLSVFEYNLGLHRISEIIDGRTVAEVPIWTLDDLAFPRDHSQPILDRPIGLIKSDTQGSESLILRGGQRLIRRDRPILCLECEPYLIGKDAVLHLIEQLVELGYETFRLFHANIREPGAILAECPSPLNAHEVRDQIQSGLVGPYGTLLSWPYPNGL